MNPSTSSKWAGCPPNLKSSQLGTSYLRLLAALPALEAPPNGVGGAISFALILFCLGFFFSRLPLLN